jgi:hypothetical protein
MSAPIYTRIAEVCRRLLLGGAVHSSDPHVWAAWHQSGSIKVNTGRNAFEHHETLYEAARAFVWAELASHGTPQPWSC